MVHLHDSVSQLLLSILNLFPHHLQGADYYVDMFDYQGQRSEIEVSYGLVILVCMGHTLQAASLPSRTGDEGCLAGFLVHAGIQANASMRYEAALASNRVQVSQLYLFPPNILYALGVSNSADAVSLFSCINDGRCLLYRFCSGRGWCKFRDSTPAESTGSKAQTLTFRYVCVCLEDFTGAQCQRRRGRCRTDYVLVVITAAVAAWTFFVHAYLIAQSGSARVNPYMRKLWTKVIKIRREGKALQLRRGRVYLALKQRGE